MRIYFVTNDPKPKPTKQELQKTITRDYRSYESYIRMWHPAMINWPGYKKRKKVVLSELAELINGNWRNYQDLHN